MKLRSIFIAAALVVAIALVFSHGGSEAGVNVKVGGTIADTVEVGGQIGVDVAEFASASVVIQPIDGEIFVGPQVDVRFPLNIALCAPYAAVTPYVGAGILVDPKELEKDNAIYFGVAGFGVSLSDAFGVYAEARARKWFRDPDEAMSLSYAAGLSLSF